MVQIQFYHVQEDRMSAVYGPYEYIQGTYDAIRVGTDGDRELAYLKDGLWQTDDGARYSDYTITSA